MNDVAGNSAERTTNSSSSSYNRNRIQFPAKTIVSFHSMVKNFTYLVYMIYMYLLTAIGLTPGGSSTVHIYTQTIRRTTQ
jgi:hypothetical protein